jgi:hypothetical protein
VVLRALRGSVGTDGASEGVKIADHLGLGLHRLDRHVLAGHLLHAGNLGQNCRLLGELGLADRWFCLGGEPAQDGASSQPGQRLTSHCASTIFWTESTARSRRLVNSSTFGPYLSVMTLISASIRVCTSLSCESA